MKYAAIDITKKCNLSCRHCYNRNKYFNGNKENDLSTKELLSIIDILWENKCTHINFLGGEPLLRGDISAIVEYCSQKNIKTSMTTNGIFLDFNKFKELKELGISQIDVSIDGTQEINDYIRGKGSYEKVTNNLNLILNKSDSNVIRISYTITNYNYKEFFQFIIDMYKIGIKNFLVGFYMEMSEDISEDLYIQNKQKVLESIAKEISNIYDMNLDINIELNFRPLFVYYLKWTYGDIINNNILFSKCAYKEGLVYIESNGNIHPCNVYSMPELYKFNIEEYKKTNPNVLHDNFEQEWEDRKYSFDNMFEKAISTFDICENCIFKAVCTCCPFQFKNDKDILECYYALAAMKEKIGNYTDNNKVCKQYFLLKKVGG